MTNTKRTLERLVELRQEITELIDELSDQVDNDDAEAFARLPAELREEIAIAEGLQREMIEEYNESMKF